MCDTNIDEQNNLSADTKQNNEEIIVRKTYILLNKPGAQTESMSLHDGTLAELVDQDNFTIEEVPIDDIMPGQWFVFVEPTDVSNGPCVAVNSQENFIYLCVKNNKNGSIDAKTLSQTRNDKLSLIGKINKML